MQHIRFPDRRLIALLAFVVAGAAVGVGAIVVGTGGQRQPTLARDIQPIFDSKCVTCHPVAYPYLDLRRGRSYGQLYRVSAATNPAFERVIPGRPDLSYLVIHPPDPSNRNLLTASERRTIVDWIRAGAKP
ncbi:MAG: hypothetical protein ABI927_02230 [Gaiellaceae bacterium]